MSNAFTALGAPEPLAAAIAARGYESPTPVQEAVLKSPDRDLLVSARTGSGKTVAFGLALAHQLLPLQKPGAPLALVVAPTRELAHQVARELAWLYTGGKIATCVGGADVGQELRALKGGAHIVVGTPGRLCDHLDRKSLNLGSLKALVLDEADEMLDLGFRDELTRILSGAPAGRRTLMFSATLPPEIEQLAKKYTKDPQRLALSPTSQAHADIELKAHVVAPRERMHAVVNLLRFYDPPAAIVFVATRDGVTHLTQNLLERGFAAVPLSGELSQAERTRALHALRDGRARVLVATDVAARGLDLPDVSLVIQADPPVNSEVLQHRSGRTGRAGRKGLAVILVPPAARKPVESMFRRAGAKVSFTPPPDADVIRVHDRDRLVREIEKLALSPADDDLTLARLLLKERDATELVAALVKLKRESLPAPEDLPLTVLLAKKKEPAASFEKKPFEKKPYEKFDKSRTAFEKPQSAGEDFDAPKHGREKPGGVWFRINIGRGRNADPRWLLPIICRKGEVDRRHVGRIEIMAAETRFEVARAAATHFRKAAAKPDKKDPNLKITEIVDKAR
ncbi:MAG TPA: DEAD/DEAH box helicase [Myxococcales bacterium]|nr:DEAD/DEAH box helicase [Myxococcales bacterium]